MEISCPNCLILRPVSCFPQPSPSITTLDERRTTVGFYDLSPLPPLKKVLAAGEEALGERAGGIALEVEALGLVPMFSLRFCFVLELHKTFGESWQSA